MTISWQVYWDNDLWHYRYELTSTGKDISHFIIEVSPSFSSEDILNCSWDYSYVEIDTFTDGQGNSNPNIPGPIYGIKFDGYGPDSEYWVISFDSRRAPVWGDFYAKDGVSQGVGVNAAWNEGFLRDDPTAPPSNDTIDNHILRPDTVTEIPEPSGFLVAISCLGSYAGMMRLTWPQFVFKFQCEGRALIESDRQPAACRRPLARLSELSRGQIAER